jgi:opacity protein-like surface antigen
MRNWIGLSVDKEDLAMKKTGLAVGLVACLLVGTAVAGGTPQTSVGTKQLVFQFTGLSELGLSSYQFSSLGSIVGYVMDDYDFIDLYDMPLYGGGIGFRYFFGEGMAVRPGVNISHASAKIDYVGTDEDPKATINNLAFSLVIERHLPPVHSISPYIGAGVGYDRYSLEVEPFDTMADKGKVTFSSVDVKGVAGFQWYFTDGLSLGGEYLGAFSMGKMQLEVTDDGHTEEAPEVSLTNFYWDAASVYLSVTF